MILMAAALALFQGEGLAEKEFQTLHARLLQLRKGEPWRSVPWHLSLLEAREQAVREGKPIFIWSPIGHPMADS